MSARVLRSHSNRNKESNTSERRLTGRKRKRYGKDYVDPEAYDPNLFTKGSGYEDIYDSSDSDSEIIEDFDDFIPDILEPEISDQESGDEDNNDEGSEDGEEADEEDIDYDYFDLDRDPLTSFLAQRIRSKFPDISDEEIRSSISSALGNARAELVDEYCGAVPKDTSWKETVDPSEIPVLEEELKQLRSNIKEKAPTIPKILSANLSSNEKERALQLYDALKNCEPYTLAYMEISMKISDIINSAPSRLDETINVKINELQRQMDEQAPSLEKIVNSHLTQNDKIKAVQLHTAMQQFPLYSVEWYNVQKQITAILDSAVESEEAVAHLEQCEAEMKRATVHLRNDYKNRIFQLDADPDIKNELYDIYCEMISRDPSDNRYAELKNKLNWALKLPYRKITSSTPVRTPESIRSICRAAYDTLNRKIYGMKEVKMRVIQCLNNRLYNPTSRSLIALKGKPGVGKTRIAKVIAEATGRPFQRINLGGAIDSTMFKGSDNVWSGSSPSLLLQLLSRAKSSDTVILLDEIDKLSCSEKGADIQNALLHVLDPIQNNDFQDLFLNEFNHDLSNIWFIPTMNDDTNMPRELRDRLDIIEIEPYSRDDMVQIIKRHTLPETLADKGINEGDITITNSAALRLISRLNNEIAQTGLRPIEKAISIIVSRLNLLRTLYSDKCITGDIPLDFKLNNFHGLPYELTEESVDILYTHPPSKMMSYFS